MVYEDFVADWIEQDAGGLLLQTSPRSTFIINRTTHDTYLYRDYGAAFWGDFDIEFEFFISVLPTSASDHRRLMLFTLTEALGDYANTRNPYKMVNVYVDGQSTVGGGRHVRANMTDGVGLEFVGTQIDISLNTTYYAKFFRVGTDVTLQVFSDAARTIQVGVDSDVTVGGGDTYQYAMTPQSLDFNTSYVTTGYVENLNMGLYTDGTAQNLFAKFEVQQTGTAELFAKFTLRQLTSDLQAEFIVAQLISELYAKFSIIVGTDTADLFATFSTNLIALESNLMAKFGVRLIYDLSGSGGIGFFWKGVRRGHVDIQILTPTGSLMGKFSESLEWAWVELTWDKLQEVDIDGSLPDKSQIIGLLWTYHTPGVRHLDGVYGLPKGGDRDVKGLLVIRHSAFNEIPSKFFYNHFREDLFAELALRQQQPGSTQPGRLTAIATVAPFARTTSYHSYSIMDPWGRKSVDIAGRHWVFYAEGNVLDDNKQRLAFISSKSGVWTAKTYIAGVERLYSYFGNAPWTRGPWAVHSDGTYIHLTYFDGTSNGDLIYVRGTPDVSGSIIWGATQVVTTGDEYYFLNISTDINGFPFIHYCKDFTGNWMINSSTNDGTWVTDVQYEFDTTNRSQFGMLFPLSNGNMLLIHQDDTVFDEWLWNGATWAKTIVSPSLDSRANWTAAIDFEDVLHFAYYDDVDTLFYRKRAADGVWTAFEELVTGFTVDTHPNITVGYGSQDQRDIIIFYGQNADLYYLMYHDGAWGSPQTLATLPYDVEPTSALSTPERYSGGRVVLYAQTDENFEVSPYTGTLWSVPLRIFNAPVVKAEFLLRQLTDDLKATFLLRQLTDDLKATFITYPQKNLLAEFVVIRSVPAAPRAPETYYLDAGGYTEIADTAPYNWGSGGAYGLQSPQSKKSFQALGRNWLFYCQGELNGVDNRELCFISGKGGNWTAKTYIPGAVEIGDGQGFYAVHYDGTYVHLTYLAGEHTVPLIYRRGTPFADGSIVWGAAQTAVAAAAFVMYTQLSISADASGYPFIAYSRFYDFAWTGGWRTKSSTNDGTWVTEWNVEYDTSNTIQYVMWQRLKNGDMLLLDQESYAGFTEWLWDGATFTGTALIPTEDIFWSSAIDDQGVIHLVWLDYSGGTGLYYRKRAVDGTWTTQIKLTENNLTDFMWPLISVGVGQDNVGELIVTYWEDDKVYWIRYYEGEWSSPEVLLTTFENAPVRSLEMQSNYSGDIPVYYEVPVIDVTELYHIYVSKIKTFNAPLVKAEFTVRYGKENLTAFFVVQP